MSIYDRGSVELYAKHVVVTSPIIADGVTVPSGFKSDGASTPRLMWWLAPPFYGLHSRAAIVHDYLYASGEQTRKQADKIFYCLMRSSGVGRCKAGSMWMAVRCFGWRNYKS